MDLPDLFHEVASDLLHDPPSDGILADEFVMDAIMSCLPELDQIERILIDWPCVLDLYGGRDDASEMHSMNALMCYLHNDLFEWWERQTFRVGRITLVLDGDTMDIHEVLFP